MRLLTLFILLFSCRPSGQSREDLRKFVTLTGEETTDKTSSNSTDANTQSDVVTNTTSSNSNSSSNSSSNSNSDSSSNANNSTSSSSSSYITYYLDRDGDGYGDKDNSTEDDTQPSGYVSNNLDCDDTDDEVYPDANEICGDISDKNCDGVILTTLYPDQDEDGYGNSNGTTLIASSITCRYDNYSLLGGDCDDSNALLTPETKWYEDYDGDGAGDNTGIAIYTQCENPSTSGISFSLNQNDCDDEDPTMYSSDTGCRVEEDENDSNYSTYYFDEDGDGYGNPSVTTEASSQPTGYVANATDCNDLDDTSYPGADEICGDTVDKNCDGFISNTLYPDLDEDDYGDPNGVTLEASTANCLLAKYSLSPTDCNDQDKTINPETKWYEDYDSDGYGKDSGNVIYTQCEEPSSSVVDFVSNNDDCDDNDSNAYPDAPPACFIDADCDGTKEKSHCKIVEVQVLSATNPSSEEGTLATLSCEENWIMTGCTCHEAHEGCGRGSFMKKEDDGSITCNARNTNNNAVTVTAECLHLGTPDDTSLFMTDYAISIVASDLSGTADNDSTTSSCASGYTMTACSCYSTGPSCGDGAYIKEDNTCFAQADGSGQGVYAVATCLKISGEHNITLKRLDGDVSTPTDDAASLKSCPISYAAVACSCFNNTKGCHDGAAFSSSGRACSAYRDSSGTDSTAGVTAKLNCLKID